MIHIIDYGLGNILSVAKAFENIAGNRKVIVTRDPEAICRASHIVLPGVGNFSTGMKNLADLDMLEPLTNQVVKNKKPFLGICLGMHLLADTGEEHGETKGLGWIPGRVRKLQAESLKLPHIGWDDMEFSASSNTLFKDISKSREFFFVHNYYFDCPEEYIIAKCNYGMSFAAAVQKDNIYSTQFHPEKSREWGLKLLSNFAGLL